MNKRVIDDAYLLSFSDFAETSESCTAAAIDHSPTCENVVHMRRSTCTQIHTQACTHTNTVRSLNAAYYI